MERLCAEHYRMYPDRIVYNDQDLLNSLLHERKRLLDMKWNVQEGAYRRPKGKSAGWVPPISKRLPVRPFCIIPGASLGNTTACILCDGYISNTRACFPVWRRKNDGWAVRLHRFVHFLPYALGIKSEKYIDIRYYGSSKKTLEGSLFR